MRAFGCFISWLETNMPFYYSESVRVLGPLMEQGLEKAKAAAVLIAENTNRLVLWVGEKAPLLLDWVRPPSERTLSVHLQLTRFLSVDRIDL